MENVQYLLKYSKPPELISAQSAELCIRINARGYCRRLKKQWRPLGRRKNIGCVYFFMVLESLDLVLAALFL